MKNQTDMDLDAIIHPASRSEEPTQIGNIRLYHGMRVRITDENGSVQWFKAIGMKPKNGKLVLRTCKTPG